ncbi:MAG: TolC family protein [Alphaproteobacteria bacterium]
MKWLILSGLLITNVVQAEVLTLPDALAKARSSSPRVLGAGEAASAATAESWGAAGGMLPNISANASWSVRDSKRAGVATTTHPTGEDITLVQPITLGDEWSRWRTMASLARASEAEAKAAKQEVTVAVVSAYADVLAAEGEVSGTQALVKALAREVSATAVRLKYGEGTKTDAAQSEARLAQAQARLAAAEGKHTTAHSTLQRWVGPLETSITLVWPSAADVATTVSATTNPAVAAAEARAQAGKHTALAAWWEFLPEANLTASTSHNDDSVAAGGGSQSAQTLMVNVSLPLFEGGQNIANLSANRAKERQARYELEDIRRSWSTLLATAQSDVTATQLGEQAAKAALDAQVRATEGIHREFELGTRSQLDVLNAEQELAQARTAWLTARRNALVAHYNVLAAEGRLSE